VSDGVEECGSAGVCIFETSGRADDEWGNLTVDEVEELSEDRLEKSWHEALDLLDGLGWGGKAMVRAKIV
jgi:hypothetical protein